MKLKSWNTFVSTNDLAESGFSGVQTYANEWFYCPLALLQSGG